MQGRHAHVASQSSATRLFVQQLVKVDMNEIIKAPHYWPFVRIIPGWPVGSLLERGLQCSSSVQCICRAMMTSSNGNIFRVTGHLCEEFSSHRWIPAQRPVARSFDVFFDLLLNTRLNKQWWGWWFETPASPLWCHCNVQSSGHAAQQ